MIDTLIAPEIEEDTSKIYWAALQNDANLISALNDKFERFLDLIDSTGLYRRVRKSIDLYHGITDGGSALHDGILVSGEDNEIVTTSFNAYRSSLSLLKTYITGARIEWDTLATNTGKDSLLATKKANNLLDACILDSTSGVEQAIMQSVEDALVMSAGWLMVKKDHTKGEELMADSSTGQIYRRGDVKCCNLTLADVAHSTTVRDPKESPWLIARYRVNRWDLVAEFPSMKDKILEIQSREDYAKYDFRLDETTRDEDMIWKYYFYHKQTPAIPRGRYVCWAGDLLLQKYDFLPGNHIPVHRIVPGQFLLTPFGYTHAFSAQAPQECLNAVISTIATNQNALGTHKIHKKPGEKVSQGMLETGVKVIECETFPQTVNMLPPSPELFKSVEMYMQFLERFSAVNATAHGQPANQLESGAALAFTEDRVQQAASDLVTNYDIFCSDVGTSIIRLYADIAPARPPKPVQPEPDPLMAGMDVMPPMPAEPEVEPMQVGYGDNTVKFYADDLKGIDHVAVVRGNPLLRTLGGRIKAGEALRATGDVDGEEWLTLIATGSLDKLKETRDGQLDLIHAENDAMLRGEMTHVALNTDNQILHIKLHAAPLSRPEVRSDPAALQAHLSAILQHQEMMLDPMTLTFQTLLYNAPPPAPTGTAPNTSAPEGMEGQLQLKGGSNTPTDQPLSLENSASGPEVPAG